MTQSLEINSSITDSFTPATLGSAKSKIVFDFPFEATNPHQLNRINQLAPAKCLEYLRKTSFDIKTDSRERCKYYQIRNVVCGVNLVLNYQETIAPGFRSMRTPEKPTAGSDYSSENIFVSNDRQMIDLHWIYLKKMPVEKVKGYAALFDYTKPFNKALAEQFVTLGGKRNRKAELLGLPMFCELQLCAIRSSKTANRLATIESIHKRNIRAVKEFLTLPNSRTDREVVESISDLYRAILVGNGVSKATVEAYKFITGKDFLEQRMRRLIKRLQPYIS